MKASKTIKNHATKALLALTTVIALSAGTGCDESEVMYSLVKGNAASLTQSDIPNSEPSVNPLKLRAHDIEENSRADQDGVGILRGGDWPATIDDRR